MEQIRQPVVDVEYRAAFGSLRGARGVLWWLLLIVVLVNLAAFVLVLALPALRDAAEQAGTISIPAVGEPDDFEARVEPAQWVGTLLDVLAVILPVARLVALLAAILLVAVAASLLWTSLAGQLGGAGALASAFVWSMLLTLLLVPWQHVFPRVGFPGALFTMQELLAGTRDVVWRTGAAWHEHVLYYARFVGYPVLVLLILILLQVKFSRGRRRIGRAEPQPVERRPVV